jgi:putative two-component system response regulator
MKHSILIIEDSEISRALFGKLFGADYVVTFATNGREGLDLLNEKFFSLIIVNLFMPTMDGFTFLKELAKTPLSYIPTIVVSSSNSLDDQRECFKLGAADFIQVPYDPVILIHKVENLINGQKNSKNFVISDLHVFEYLNDSVFVTDAETH